MKKITLFVISMLFLALGTVQAQNFGVKAGINFSNINLDYDAVDGVSVPFQDPSSTWGLAAGFFYDRSFNDLMGLRAELLYSMKGSGKYNDISDEDLKLHYLSLPILLKVNVIKAISVEGGVETSFLVKSDNTTLDAITWDPAKLDFGLALGAYLNFTPKLELGLRYVHGVLNFADADLIFTDNTGAAVDVNWNNTNRTLQATLGFKF